MKSRIVAGLRWVLKPPPSVTLLALVLGGVAQAARSAGIWNEERRIADDFLEEGRTVPVFATSPRVSVLAAVWNEGDDVDALVRSFSEIDYPQKELIVAIGGAHDCREYASPAENVTLLEHPGGGLIRAFAACLRQAHGEIICTTGGDCRLTSEGFRRLIAPIANGEADATTGSFIPLREQRDDPFVVLQWSGATWPQRFIDRRRTGLTGANAAIRRTALDAVGSFEFQSLADDAYLGRLLTRAGFSILHVPHSVVETHHHQEVRPYLHQQARWRRGNFLVRQEFDARQSEARLLRGALSDGIILGLTALLPWLTRSWLVLLCALVVQRYAVSLRQLAFMCRIGFVSWRPLLLVFALLKVYVDCLIRPLTLIQLHSRRKRTAW